MVFETVRPLVLLLFLGIVVAHYCLLGIGVYAYPEILNNHLGFSPFIFLNIAELVILFCLLFKHKTKEDLLKALKRPVLILHSILILLLLSTWTVFTILESLNFDNYIFSTFHINLSGLNLLVNYSMILEFALILLFNNKWFLKINFQKKNSVKLRDIRLVLFIFLLVSLGNFVIVNSKSTLIDGLKRIIFISQHSAWTYEEKMEYNWGDFYRYMQMLVIHTPENAIILIPPAESHWLSTGNSVLVRYFLFPRKVISCTTIYCLPPSGATHVILSKGLWQDPTIPYGWPKVTLDANNIKYFNLQSKEITNITGENYDPNLSLNQESWGVITLKQP